MNNILYIPTRYFPSISGAEFYFQRLAEIFNSKFNDTYNVDIFTSNAIDFKALRAPKGRIIEKNHKYFNIVNNLRINRFSISYTTPFKDKFNYIKDLDPYSLLNISDECLEHFIENGPFLPDLIDYFLKTNIVQYDLIHATFFPYFNLIISLIIGKLLNKPTVCTPFFHFANPRYSKSVMSEVLTNFDLIVACTNLEKKYLIEALNLSESKIVVIPMGVDYKIFKTKKRIRSKDYYFRNKFLRENEQKFKMVLFCGYKNYEKGAISILRSIPIILNKIKKVYFVLIGPSTLAYNRELSKVRKLKNARIINFTPENLTGYFDKKKIAAFKETDLFLMPSRTDAFGIAFLEAWAARKPVIGANIGATSEVIRNNIDGFLVEYDSPEDIAEKVVSMLRNKKLRKKMGNAGRLKVKENYSWDNIAKKTHDVYKNLINR